jgi:simple sugar transport system ATP-binding protein
MQQRVEILKTLYRDARILILDEPTAVLTAQESQELFEVLRALTEDGVSIVFISHKLNEVLEISDRVTGAAARREDRHGAHRGRNRGEPRAADGGPRRAAPRWRRSHARPGEPMLEVEDLHVLDQRGLEAGEGRSRSRCAAARWWLSRAWTATASSSWCRPIAGVVVPDSGSVSIAGEDVTGEGVRETTEAGVATSRRTASCVGSCSTSPLAENLALREYRQPPISNHGVLSMSGMNARAASLLKEYDVRGGEPSTLAELAVGREPAEGRGGARGRERTRSS